MLGIDISSAAIKLLELSKSNDYYRVEHYSVEPLPAGAVFESNITNVDAVGQAVLRALKRSKSNAKNVALAVTGSAVITRMIEMKASLSDIEMEAQISVEADQYIPYPLDEVALDFEVQGLSTSNPDVAEVLLAACRSEDINLREEVCGIAKLNCKIVDIEAYAMQRAFQLVTKQIKGGIGKKIVAVIDIGATVTTLTVLKENKIIYTRDQLFGGQQLTEEIQRHYSLSFQDAGKMKKQGGLPDSYETDVLKPFLNEATQHVMRALQFFYSSTQYTMVDYIVLAGGSASVKGLNEQVKEETDRPIIIANPFINMSLSPAVESFLLAKDAPSLMLACGLAMRGFD